MDAHVNGDDAEAVLNVCRLAADWRAELAKVHTRVPKSRHPEIQNQQEIGLLNSPSFRSHFKPRHCGTEARNTT